jgi:hypothetical protein
MYVGRTGRYIGKYINIYRFDGNDITATPLPSKREWMKDGGGLNCPPMMLGNTLGWYYGLEEDITFNWDGNNAPGSVKITNTVTGNPVSNDIANNNFGQGVITFGGSKSHFETSEGYSLLLSGPSNMWINGINPCTGIVETDWSAFPFPMNWKITIINQDIYLLHHIKNESTKLNNVQSPIFNQRFNATGGKIKKVTKKNSK